MYRVQSAGDDLSYENLPAPTHSESSGRFTKRLTKVASLSSKHKGNFVNLN